MILQSDLGEHAKQSIQGGTDFVRSLGVLGELSSEDIGRVVGAYRHVEQQFAPDLVLAGPLSDCAYIKALARSAPPFIAQSWAFDVLWEARQNDDKNGRCRQAIRCCAGLFADCDAVVAECEKLVAERIPRTFIMPWGLETASCVKREAREVIRHELQLTGKYVFLHTRGLEPVYSVETLLEAFREAHSEFPQATLLLASSGSLKPTVQNFVRRSGLENAIKLLGSMPHERVLNLFLAADCYVSCAASDGTSISMLEAMTARLPVIVSDVGGNSEWVQNEINGWVSPLGDTGNLRRVLVDAIRIEPARRNRFIEHNYRLVQERADWAKNFGIFVAFLEACAGSTRGGCSGPKSRPLNLTQST